MNHKTIDDCRTPQDYIHFAEGRGATVTRNGTYATIKTARGAVHVRDCSRAIGKGERELFRFWMWGLGLLGGLIAVAVFLIGKA